MVPGDSFSLPLKRWPNVSQGVYQFRRRGGLGKFVISETLPGMLRCWRIPEAVEVRIDRDIKPPPRLVWNTTNPMRRMEVGDSFEVRNAQYSVKFLYENASRLKRTIGLIFTIRKIEDGVYRIWRIQ
jgi:hypothetical protein